MAAKGAASSRSVAAVHSRQAFSRQVVAGNQDGKHHAETGLGATACASASQNWNGAMAALIRSALERRQNAAMATVSCGETAMLRASAAKSNAPGGTSRAVFPRFSDPLSPAAAASRSRRYPIGWRAQSGAPLIHEVTRRAPLLSGSGNQTKRRTGTTNVSRCCRSWPGRQFGTAQENRRAPQVARPTGIVNQRRLHQVFEISVLLKGLNGLLECAAGIALYLVSTQTIVSLIYRAAHHELIARPHNFLAQHLMGAAQQFSVATKSFYSAYLVGHGVIKLVLVVGLLRGWRWSYPVAIVALAGFVTYQLHRIWLTHGVLLAVLTGFDVFLIAMIWHEWRASQTVRPDRALVSRYADSPVAPVRGTPERGE